jgi:hypothetical protein
MCKRHTPIYDIYCREIYNKHPQGKGILPYDIFLKKYGEELKIGFEFLIL